MIKRGAVSRLQAAIVVKTIEPRSVTWRHHDPVLAARIAPPAGDVIVQFILCVGSECRQILAQQLLPMLEESVGAATGIGRTERIAGARSGAIETLARNVQVV